MPWDGSQNYQLPPGTYGIPDTPVKSPPYNAFLDDLAGPAGDLNLPRPIHRGGTAATTALQARTNLKAEASSVQVTNYASQVFESGSFWSNTTTGQGAPVDGHMFVGDAIVYDANNVFLTAYDLDDNQRAYNRRKTSGGWGAWSTADTSSMITPSGTANSIKGFKGSTPPGTLAWELQLGDDAPTSTGNAGADYRLKRYSDAGVVLDAGAMFIKRSTGQVNFGGSVSINFPVPVINAAVGSRTLTVSGDAAAGTLGIVELNTQAPDASNMGVGALIFTANAAVSAASKAICQINGNLMSGGTAGNRGGVMTFYVKADNGGLQQAGYIRNDTVWNFNSSIVVNGGTLYMGSSGYYLQQSGGNLSINGNFVCGGALYVTGNVLYMAGGGAYLNWDGSQFIFNQNVIGAGRIVANGSGGGSTYTDGVISAGYGAITALNMFIGTPSSHLARVGGYTGYGAGFEVYSDSAGGYTITTLRDYSGNTAYYALFTKYDNGVIGYIQGAGSSVVYSTTSDATLKQDVRDARGEDCLDRLRRLKLRDFQWKETKTRQIGVIAQEADEVFDRDSKIVLPPGVIAEVDATGKKTGEAQTPWAMNYPGMVPYLIGAVQSLADKVDALERR